MSDAMLLVGDSRTDANLYYTTRFLAGDPFAYLERDGTSMIVVSSMERGRAEKESTAATVRTFDDFGYRDLIETTGSRDAAFAAVVGKAMEEIGAGVARVRGSFPVLLADTLRAAGVELIVDPELLRLRRRVKGPDEIAAIEAAQRATERAMAHAIDLIGNADLRAGVLHHAGIPLTSERIRTEIEVLLTRAGMDISDAPIVAGGAGAADPHYLGAGPLRAGEAIVIDIFPRARATRYFADMTRTVVKGDPGETLTAMYDATALALDAAIALIRAGVNGRDVHQAVLDVYEGAGFGGDGDGPRLIHGTGHGVGLDIHEGPNLGAVDVELLPGDVVTVEPGLYDPKIGGVRIEDLVVVTEQGCRNLTEFPRRFRL